MPNGVVVLGKKKVTNQRQKERNRQNSLDLRNVVPPLFYTKPHQLPGCTTDGNAEHFYPHHLCQCFAENPAILSNHYALPKTQP